MMSVSDLVQRSLTNTQTLLNQEQEQTLHVDKKQEKPDAGHTGGNVVEADDALEEK